MLAIVCAGACRKPATDAALDRPGARTKPAAVFPSAPIGAPSASPESTPERIAPIVADRPPPPDLSPEIPEQEVAKLSAEFAQPDTDEARRAEVVGELSVIGTSSARQALTRIYRTARSVEVKKDVIEALRLMESDDIEPSLLLIQDAAAANQPLELRETAVDTLRDLISPKTLRVWQTLLADPNEEIRNAAKAMIAFLAAEETGR